MWKVIKEHLESVNIKKQRFSLWMKWKFFIEFVSDRFGPYEYKFEKEDTYFLDKLEDRWAVLFPLKEKTFDNTELFIENDDIILAIGKRWWLSIKESYFIDIINIKTEKKYRIFTDEISLVTLTEEWLLINFLDSDKEWKIIILDYENMKVKEEKKRKISCIF